MKWLMVYCWIFISALLTLGSWLLARGDEVGFLCVGLAGVYIYKLHFKRHL